MEEEKKNDDNISTNVTDNTENNVVSSLRLARSEALDSAKRVPVLSS